MAVAVHLNRSPHNAFLAAWGRHATGWWACVTFRARVTGDGDGDGELTLDVAAWVPAHAVTKPGYVNASAVPRTALPDDRRAWTGPPGWPAWYAGVWADGPLPLPPGLTLLTGAAWRNKPPRSPNGATG